MAVVSSAPFASSNAPLEAATTSPAVVLAVMDVSINVTRDAIATAGTDLSPTCPKFSAKCTATRTHTDTAMKFIHP